MLFSSLKLKNFEWEWWKPKTPNWCFHKLKTEFQWHDGKYCDFMGPTVRHSRPHMCSNIFFFFTFSLHRTDISSLPLLFSLFFLSFLLQAGFFQLLLFFLSFFFFFFMARFFHLLLFFLFLFSFLFFFFTLVSFLLFLHAMMAKMAKGFDFSCDLHFNRVKVCFLGLELWILWGNFFWCFFLFLFSLYICKRICYDVEGVSGFAMVDGFYFWWFVRWWMQNNGGGLDIWELQLVGLWIVGGGRDWKWEEKGFNVLGFMKEERKKNERNEGERHVTVLICTVHRFHHFVKILS